MSQLDSSTLVAMGHIVCGAKSTEMSFFNAVEFGWANNIFKGHFLTSSLWALIVNILTGCPSCCLPSGGCSKAVLWLGQLMLSCSEEQLVALVGLLTHSLAFGPISSWGTDVFIEIGVLAGIIMSPWTDLFSWLQLSVSLIWLSTSPSLNILHFLQLDSQTWPCLLWWRNK